MTKTVQIVNCDIGGIAQNCDNFIVNGNSIVNLAGIFSSTSCYNKIITTNLMHVFKGLILKHVYTKSYSNHPNIPNDNAIVA